MRVNVLAATPAVVRQYADESRRCLVGDRTCSLDNVRRSCFAIELCERDRSAPVANLDLHTMRNHAHTLVAVDFDTKSFLGCLTLDDAPSMLAGRLAAGENDRPRKDDGFLSNLCVSDEHRSRHVGSTLVHHARCMYARIWLMVCTEDWATDGGEQREMLCERKRKLVGFYEQLGFREHSLTTCKRLLVMCSAHH